MTAVQIPDRLRQAYQQLLQSSGKNGNDIRRSSLWQALENNPRDLEAIAGLVTCAAEAGQYTVAETFIRYALTFQPESARLHFSLALVLKAMGRLEQALSAFMVSLEHDPDNETAYVEVAYVYLALQRSDEQKTWLEKALQKYPHNYQLLVLMGEAVKRRGNIEMALDFFRQALRLAPEDSYIYQTLAHTKKFQRHDDDVAAMEALLAHGERPVADRIRLCFALGKAYEDMADFATSFDYYQRGNYLVRQGNDYHQSQTEKTFAAIEQAFDDALFRQFDGGGVDSDLPVFIVSMPRSGSTLIEKMLAAHPDVHGGGELNLMHMIATSIWARHIKPAGSEFPTSVASLSPTLLADAGRFYVNEIKKLAGDKKVIRITDKMPHNFIYVGLIRLLLPRARIIHCSREPLDTCLSCFKHLFSGVHAYAYDLQDLGHYYRHYQRLMAHWNRVLPGWMLEVSYEALVQDQAGELRRILEFCDLPWNAACLKFHESKHHALTASSVQVSKPLYSNAIAYWRNYAAHLDPLRKALEGR